jgi:hypothetical protein
VIVRRTGLGSLKVVDNFPLTEDGWARAWQSLVNDVLFLEDRLVVFAHRQAKVLAEVPSGRNCLLANRLKYRLCG